MSVLRDRLKICGLCLHSCTKPVSQQLFLQPVRKAEENRRQHRRRAVRIPAESACLPDHRSEKPEKIPPETEDPLFFQFSELYCHMAPVDCEIIGQLLTVERNFKGRRAVKLRLRGKIGEKLFADSAL